jgi:MFS family permease
VSAAAGGGYRTVLRVPHAAAAFGAALVGRLSFATVSLALLLTVQRATGSYATAGAATALFGLTNVILSPARARLVDRRGQRGPLRWLAAGYATALLVVAALAAVAAGHGLPGWTLVVPAVAAGACAPPLGPAMRALWAVLTPDPATLTRAYSLDAVAEELLFVAGPLVVAAIVLVAPPATALVVAGLLSVAGTLAMTRSPATLAPAAAPLQTGELEARPLRRRGFRPLLVAMLGVGAVLGTVEVAVPGFAQEHGHAAAAGPLLSLLSVGSATGGLLYGRRAWTLPAGARLLLLAGGLSLASGTLVLAAGTALLGALLVGVGVLLAPVLITGYLLADQLAPAHARTEASSWINTATNAGAAASAALAGLVVDQRGPTTALAAGAVLAGACTLLATLRAGSLSG